MARRHETCDRTVAEGKRTTLVSDRELKVKTRRPACSRLRVDGEEGVVDQASSCRAITRRLNVTIELHT